MPNRVGAAAMRHYARVFVVVAAMAGVVGCANTEQRKVMSRQHGESAPQYEEPESIFGEGGVSFGGKKEQVDGGGIGVNSFLWRASLDTISFMPLVSADPFGGVIITDWYSPQSPNERFKVNVYILGRSLRADAVRVSVFRQELAGAAGWIDAAVNDDTATKLENAILTGARQMRIAQQGE